MYTSKHKNTILTKYQKKNGCLSVGRGGKLEDAKQSDDMNVTRQQYTYAIFIS